MNLSQEELAEKIYVTRQTISNWENDKSYPDIHSLLLLKKKLAKKLYRNLIVMELFLQYF